MKMLPLLLLAPVALLASGCVATRYKSAPRDTPPPTILNWSTTQPPIAINVHSVIVIYGAGSWKREAYWDEYVVSVANQGPAPLTLDSASLTDFQGTALAPGSEPWELERESKTSNERLAATLGDTLKVGSATFALGLLPAGMGGFAAMGGSAAGAAVALWTWPVLAAGSVYRNLSSRAAIGEEFNRRRMKLPLTIAPGAIAQGSLFFRIAPGPQRLAFRHHVGREAGAAAIELKQLSSLHLNSAPTANRPSL